MKQAFETKTSIGGMYAAGLFTGVGIAAVVICVMYFLYIRRRCLKNSDPGPASLFDPTYSGLTDLSRPVTHDVINQPEDGSKTSESSEAPVYQNAASAS